MTTPRTIDMTPTFTETARMLIAVMENGTETGKDFARSEIIKWGTMLDAMKAHQQATKTQKEDER